MNAELVSRLLQGVNNVSWQSLVMIAIAGVLFYLAIVKDYEPLLLLPIGAGCLLANLPLSPMLAEDGLHPSVAMHARWTGAALPVAKALLATA